MRIVANCCFQKFDFFLVPFQRAIVSFLHLDSAFSLHCSSLPRNILKINKNEYFPKQAEWSVTDPFIVRAKYTTRMSSFQ